MQRLPQTLSLSAFVIAARTLSLTRTARDLNMTTSAVSQRIKQMEHDVGCALFVRSPHGLSLSAEGHAFLPYAEDAIARLTAGLDALQDPALPQQLRILALSSFSAKWLAPRMTEFSERNTSIETALFHDHRVPQFEAGKIDVAVLWGTGDWENCDRQLFLTERRFPVCSPAYAARLTGQSIQKCASNTVLLTTAILSEWPQWLEGKGCVVEDFERVHAFDDGALMIDAARRGQGLALARSCLAFSSLRRGELVIPFSDIQDSENGYYIVTPKSRKPSSAMQSFIDWLKEEAAAFAIDETALLSQAPTA